MNSASEGNAYQLAIRLAKGIASFAPDYGNLLVKLVDEFIIRYLPRLVSSGQKKDLLSVRSVIEALDETRRYQYSILVSGNDSGIKRNVSQTDIVNQLTSKIQEIITVIAESGSDPDGYLFASNLMSSFVGLDGAIEIIQKGRAHYPQDVSLQSKLAGAFLAKAENSSGESRWVNYKNALSEFLSMYIAEPHNTKVLSRLVAIASRYRDEQGKWKKI